MSIEEKPQMQSNDNYQSTTSDDIADNKNTARPLLDKEILQNDASVYVNSSNHSCVSKERTVPPQDVHDLFSTSSLRISRAPLSESGTVYKRFVPN